MSLLGLSPGEEYDYRVVEQLARAMSALAGELPAS